MLTRWGRFVHRHPAWTLAIFATMLGVSIAFVVRGGEMKDSRSLNLEAGHANDLVNSAFPRPAGAGGSSFSLLFTSDHLKTGDPAFETALTAAVQTLRDDPRVTSIDTPYAGNPALRDALVSADHSTAIATVSLRGTSGETRKAFDELRGKVHSDRLRILAYGGIATGHAFDKYLAADLQRAEVISLPATVILLLLVFGALVAAGLPLAVGVVSILGGFGGVYLLAGFTDVSSYAQNVVTLIGLGVSIDYSLFIVSRFREELAGGASREDALATTMATAGRAIMFSGLTVAIGLSGMLFYPGTFLPSMGLAGALVVALAVFYSLTLLPALLRLLGPRVNAVRIPIGTSGRGRVWHTLAMAVMRRPLLVLLPTVAFVVVAGIPFAHLRMANGDINQLPRSAEVVQADTLARAKFPGRDQTTIVVVDQFSGSPRTADRIGAIYDQSRRLAAIPGVASVSSAVDVDPQLTRADYQRLYTQAPPSGLPQALATAAKQSLGAHIAVVTVQTNNLAESDGAREIVRAIRASRAAGDGEVLVTGQTAFDIDIVNYIVDRTPGAVGFIVVVTYLILFLLLGSILLPVKAVVMNFLSLSASFGALVWIFQDGHLSGLLGFSPTSIDPSIPVLLFCIVFGLSMDYEVLLMSRMKEQWELSHDNRHAVAEGLELSGRLVTGAAAIMVVVFLGFGLAQVLLIKSLGLGMAIAVAIDATVVRVLIVPATMRLLGGLNWWMPAPIARLYHRLGLGESSRRSTQQGVG